MPDGVTIFGFPDVSYKDDVKRALEQADLKDVTVSEDRDKRFWATVGNGRFKRNRKTSLC